MSTHNIGFHWEIRKILILFGWKKCLIKSYGRPITYFYTSAGTIQIFISGFWLLAIIKHQSQLQQTNGLIFFFFFFFRENKSWHFHLPSKQMIHMKCWDLLSLKNKNFRVSSATHFGLHLRFEGNFIGSIKAFWDNIFDQLNFSQNSSWKWNKASFFGFFGGFTGAITRSLVCLSASILYSEWLLE